MEMKIKITQKQWDNIQEIMKKHNCSQDEAVAYLMQIGMREMKFREDYE